MSDKTKLPYTEEELLKDLTAENAHSDLITEVIHVDDMDMQEFEFQINVKLPEG